MKLITDAVFSNENKLLTEEIILESGEKKKRRYLTGIYLEAEIKNANGRIYPSKLIKEEVNRYVNESVLKGNAYGECDHPDTPTVSIKNASHRITELKFIDNVGYGKAIILDNPMGKMLESCFDSGGVLGMSTRGVGNINNDIVESYILSSIDAVTNPSAPHAFVNGILENKEYILAGDGNVVESHIIRAVENLQSKVDNQWDKFGMSDFALKYMLEFLGDIKKKI